MQSLDGSQWKKINNFIVHPHIDGGCEFLRRMCSGAYEDFSEYEDETIDS